MNDAFGKIIVVGEYEGDLKAIVAVLNSLRWGLYPDGEEHRWDIEQGVVCERPGVNRDIIVLNGDMNFPILLPIGDILVLKDGERCFANNADESFIKQWKAEEGDGTKSWDYCTLSELSALISPHLTEGAIEFVAVHASSGSYGCHLVRSLLEMQCALGEARASHGCLYHERLLVRSDGSAELHKCHKINWTGLEGKTYSEYYEPSILAALAAKDIPGQNSAATMG
jgi:hypothetical protein